MRISDWSSDVCSSDLAGEYALLLALVLSEIIEAERAVVGVHIVDGVVDAAIGADRQHGPEYLFLHHLHLVGDAADDVERHLVAVGAREILVPRVDLDHFGALVARVGQLGLPAGVIAAVDARRVVLLCWPSRIERRPPPCRTVDPPPPPTP